MLSHHKNAHVLVLREQEAGSPLTDSILEVGYLLNNLQQQKLVSSPSHKALLYTSK